MLADTLQEVEFLVYELRPLRKSQMNTVRIDYLQIRPEIQVAVVDDVHSVTLKKILLHEIGLE